MLKKQIVLFILVIAVVAVVSGCAKKPQGKQITANNQVKNQDKIATSTGENGYTIKNDENGWKIFKSEKCGFEISYPQEFKESQHCEEMNFPQMKIKNLLSIGYFSGKDIYGAEGDISFSIRKGSASNNEDKLKIEDKIVGYDEKSGKTITTAEKIEFMGTSTTMINKEYFNPIEGPSGVLKIIYFEYKGQKYFIQSQIPHNNKKTSNLFLKIIKTFKFIDNDSDIDSSQNNSKEETKLQIADIKGWVAYKNKTIGINFDYPDDWKLNESNNQHVVLFTNLDSNFRFLLHYPSQPTGFEGQELVSTSYYKTNIPTINLKYYLLELSNELNKTYTAVIMWENKMIDEKKDPERGLIMIDFSDSNKDYYLYAVNKLIKTIKFIK